MNRDYYAILKNAEDQGVDVLKKLKQLLLIRGTVTKLENVKKTIQKFGDLPPLQKRDLEAYINELEGSEGGSVIEESKSQNSKKSIGSKKSKKSQLQPVQEVIEESKSEEARKIEQQREKAEMIVQERRKAELEDQLKSIEIVNEALKRYKRFQFNPTIRLENQEVINRLALNYQGIYSHEELKKLNESIFKLSQSGDPAARGMAHEFYDKVLEVANEQLAFGVKAEREKRAAQQRVSLLEREDLSSLDRKIEYEHSGSDIPNISYDRASIRSDPNSGNGNIAVNASGNTGAIVPDQRRQIYDPLLGRTIEEQKRMGPKPAKKLKIKSKEDLDKYMQLMMELSEDTNGIQEKAHSVHSKIRSEHERRSQQSENQSQKSARYPVSEFDRQFGYENLSQKSAKYPLSEFNRQFGYENNPHVQARSNQSVHYLPELSNEQIRQRQVQSERAQEEVKQQLAPRKAVTEAGSRNVIIPNNQLDAPDSNVQNRRYPNVYDIQDDLNAIADNLAQEFNLTRQQHRMLLESINAGDMMQQIQNMYFIREWAAGYDFKNQQKAKNRQIRVERSLQRRDLEQQKLRDKEAILKSLGNDKAFYPLSKAEKAKLMNLPIIGVRKKIDVNFEEQGQVAGFMDNFDEDGNIVINVGDMVEFVYGAAAFVSDVNGDIDPDDAFLANYKKQVDVFKPSIKKKEPTQFAISAGAAFKLRKC